MFSSGSYRLTNRLITLGDRESPPAAGQRHRHGLRAGDAYDPHSAEVNNSAMLGTAPLTSCVNTADPFMTPLQPARQFLEIKSLI